jgi:hypothetical protein
MKYLKLYIVLLGIVASFFFFNKDISESTVHRMIQDNFRIEVNSCGCFGCYDQIATVYKENNKRWLKLTSSGTKEASIIEFTQEREKQLESIVISIINKRVNGYCTQDAEYSFENNGFRFKIFEYRSCSLKLFLME